MVVLVQVRQGTFALLGCSFPPAHQRSRAPDANRQVVRSLGKASWTDNPARFPWDVVLGNECHQPVPQFTLVFQGSVHALQLVEIIDEVLVERDVVLRIDLVEDSPCYLPNRHCCSNLGWFLDGSHELNLPRIHQQLSHLYLLAGHFGERNVPIDHQLPRCVDHAPIADKTVHARTTRTVPRWANFPPKTFSYPSFHGAQGLGNTCVRPPVLCPPGRRPLITMSTPDYKTMVKQLWGNFQIVTI